MKKKAVGEPITTTSNPTQKHGHTMQSRHVFGRPSVAAVIWQLRQPSASLARRLQTLTMMLRRKEERKEARKEGKKENERKSSRRRRGRRRRRRRRRRQCKKKNKQEQEEQKRTQTKTRTRTRARRKKKTRKRGTTRDQMHTQRL